MLIIDTWAWRRNWQSRLPGILRSWGMRLSWERKAFADDPIEIIDGDRGKNYPKHIRA